MEKVVLIMAGGSGTRFWPLSTTEKPKQFLDLISDKTMIRETIDRVSKLIPVERIFISTNISYLDIIKEQLPEIPEKNIIFEPMARDTAACIGYAALIIEKIYKNSIMAVLPSDHLIKKEKEFLKSLELAFKKAEEDVVVTLGIKPSYPETGYGYKEYFKNTKEELGDFRVFKVKGFREKPNKEIAEKYISQGNFLWNSGMFIWKSQFILDEIKDKMDTHKIILDRIEEILFKVDTDKIFGIKLSECVKDEFEKFEKISIDFGVMEHTKSAVVIPIDIEWNDVGSFKSLEDVFTKDKNGNIIKTTKYEEIESERNIVINKEENKIIATIGLEDIVIVNTKDALLVCHKDKSQEVKKILDKIDKKNNFKN